MPRPGEIGVDNVPLHRSMIRVVHAGGVERFPSGASYTRELKEVEQERREKKMDQEREDGRVGWDKR